MVGCLNRCEFEQAPGDGEGQGSLVCYSPWGCKESDMTERLSNGGATLLQNGRLGMSTECLEFTVHLKDGDYGGQKTRIL